MPRIISSQRYTPALLHGREQTPFGSQTPLGKDDGPQDTARVSLTLPPFETSVSLSDCQGTKEQRSPLTLFVQIPRSKLELPQFVTPEAQSPLDVAIPRRDDSFRAYRTQTAHFSNRLTI